MGASPRGFFFVQNADLILLTTSDLLAVLRPSEDALGKTASPDPEA